MRGDSVSQIYGQFVSSSVDSLVSVAKYIHIFSNI